jgi:hypothetical protein
MGAFMLNKLIATAILFSSFSSFAVCITEEKKTICQGEIVFRTVSYGVKGAEVIAINTRSKTATVKSIEYGSLYQITPKVLDITKGCIEGICVGDIVLKGADFGANGAIVLAIDVSSSMILVILNQTDKSYTHMYKIKPSTVDILNENKEYTEAMRIEDLYNDGPSTYNKK